MGEILKRPTGSVLVAVSHGGLGEGIRGLLATEFESVVMVADESSLCACATQLRPDLAVMDVQLGGGGEGPRLISRLRSLLPETKVLALGGSDPSLTRAALAAGADGYLAKSTLGSELLPAVERLRKGRAGACAGPGNGAPPGGPGRSGNGSEAA